MQYLIVEYMHGTAQCFYGPFPSQCQATTYMESFRDTQPGVTFQVTVLYKPAYMPERIHD